MDEENYQAENNSGGDVVPDTLVTPKVSNYRLPRFNSRRMSSSDQDLLPRTNSMFPYPQELTKDNLTSAEALMADGVFTMNSTLSSVIEEALGHPIPGLKVRFRNLELSAKVPQIKSGGLEVPTLWTQMQQGVTSLCAPKKSGLMAEKKILRGISGVFKPGRITLVLGQPGSGKSSLMKVLANQFHMDKNITLNGAIEYSGKDRTELLEVLPRYVAYANQIDDHYPRLTVQETFEFAHRCCAGKGLEPWVVEALKHCTPEQREHALEVMTAHHKFAPDVTVKKLGLENCKDTVVGNAMLRGVSGASRLQLLDEISTGLDSAATYDICKSMKSAARNFNATVVISLLQPSPEVFELFDDVLLLNEGTIMFHGKREDAVPYFERMGFHCPPRKDVADFLLDLGTDKQDVYVTGDASVPYQSADFAKLFTDSDIFQKTLKRLDASTDAMVFADLKPFRQTYTEDLATLLQRQVMLTLRDTTYIMGRAVMVIVMGLLYGSTFWQMDDTDSQLMLGLLFSCAMFLSMSQASQVSTYMDARSVFYKQRGANFFRTSAYVLATSITQIPLCIMETVVFGAIVYWMGGYVDAVDRFTVFLVTLFLCQMWFTSFFFFLSSASPNLTIAQPVMFVVVLFFMLFGGFLIAKDDIPDYLIWVYWIDPLAWCIRALSVNQYLAPKFDVCVYKGTDYCAEYSQTVGKYTLSVFNLETESMWIWYGWIFLAAGYFISIFCSYLVLEYMRFESPENVALTQHDDDAISDQSAYSKMPATPKEHENIVEIDGIVTTNAFTTSNVVPVTLAFHDLWYS
ncbi:hypothetical protein F442_09262, partial [Phytophthora nicotianae P10297]